MKDVYHDIFKALFCDTASMQLESDLRVYMPHYEYFDGKKFLKLKHVEIIARARCWYIRNHVK